MKQRLAGLALRTATAIATPAVAKTVAGQRYVFPKNALAIESLTLTPSASDGNVTEIAARIAGADSRFTAPVGGWQRGELAVGSEITPIAASGAWTAADTFTLELLRTHTPFTVRYDLTFSEEQVSIAAQQNVGAPPNAPIRITGRREIIGAGH